MKIFVITDIHSKPEKVFDYLNNNEVDQIIVTGDITEFGPESLVKEILNKLNGYAPVFAIPGNCDPTSITTLIDESDATNIHGKANNIDDITLVGFGGSNPTPFNTPNEYPDEILYEELSKYKDQLKSDNITILVTHAPPYDTKADIIETGDHVGSKGIRKIIDETHPTINLCGHVHESIASDKIDETLIINPGDAGSGHACLLEIKDKDNIKETLLTL